MAACQRGERIEGRRQDQPVERTAAGEARRNAAADAEADRDDSVGFERFRDEVMDERRVGEQRLGARPAATGSVAALVEGDHRSEERRVGTEGVSTCRYTVLPGTKKNKQHTTNQHPTQP